MSEQLVESDFAHAMTAEIKKEETTLVQAKDWPDFKERAGRIKGLKKAVQIHNDLVKRLNEHDIDDDEEDDEDLI